MENIHRMRTELEDQAIELRNKKQYIESRTISSRYDDIVQGDKESADLVLEDDDIQMSPGWLTNKNTEYLNLIKTALPCINNTLTEFICLAPKSVYLFGGVTGKGKSTTVANITAPILAAGKKVLVISNEETVEDVFVRVACHNLKVSFHSFKRGTLPKEIVQLVNHESERITPQLTVIGVNFKNNPNFTTTPEGLIKLFEKFAHRHDAVLLDYFQNINHSTSKARKDAMPWDHQRTFCYFLNQFKDKYNGPIVILSQLYNPTKKDTTSFPDRIQGCKMLANVCQVHIEIKPNFDEFSTTFFCYKDRFFNMGGLGAKVGFDLSTNRYVEYDDAFKQKAASWQADRAIGKVDPQAQDEDSEVKVSNSATEEAFLDELNLDF